MALKSSEVPATKAMLDETRNELKSDITSLRIEMKTEIGLVKSELGAEISAARHELGPEISSLSFEVQKLSANVHRVLCIVEEQEARNKYVLDGYASISLRQDVLEAKTESSFQELKSLIVNRL